MPHADPSFLLALVAFAHRRVLNRAVGITGQMAGHEVEIGEDFVVVALGAGGHNTATPARVTDFDSKTGSATVHIGAQTYRLASDTRLGESRMSGTSNGQSFTAQVERGTLKNPLAVRVQHDGTQVIAIPMSPRGAELYTLMPYKAPPDMSRYVLSPMPGLLVDVAVQVGQKVQAGERVAVIEAMKMENVLFAAADGVVGKVLAAKGESLTVDQPIVEFS